MTYKFKIKDKEYMALVETVPTLNEFSGEVQELTKIIIGEVKSEPGEGKLR